MALKVLDVCKEINGLGVVAIDCGANIGVHTIEWAKHMFGWGEVVSFEAQEKIYYALAGNVTLNNCFNARVFHAAVGLECGTIQIPVPDYFKPASFGSLEIHQKPSSEFIGQNLSLQNLQSISLVSLDSLQISRLDFIKIDVEGMELDVLKGASETIGKFKPVMIIEVIKSDKEALVSYLKEFGYIAFEVGLNFLAVPSKSPIRDRIFESVFRKKSSCL